MVDVAELALVGGDLALDFANTAGGRGTSAPIETLHGAADLDAWAQRAGALRTGRLSEAAFGRALDFREAIHRAGSALAGGREPDADDLKTIVSAARRSLDKASLVRTAGGDAYSFDFEGASAEDALLGAIAWSAVEALERGGFERLKQCPAHDCGWLFYDRSKNNSRRWCDMATCGNRAKVRRSRSRPVSEG